uniref:Aldo-keto reductase n=1 Tax=Cyberlindnera americana TaxID=36016 RepID=A0A5P8N956_9ASCO|nr:aldo-keto reductase [Cyberlindnera americana]
MSQTVPWNNLGESGLKISNVIIGCMTFGSKEWADWVIDDEEEVFAILNKAYELGIRTFDTADMYSNGVSEILLGKWIKKFNIKRDKIVIMSKVFNPVDDEIKDLVKKKVTGTFTKEEEINLANGRGLSRKHILDAAENSVKRLGTYMDLYQIHRFDPETPIEETMRALNDVVEKGYTRYIGASTMRAVEFVMMQNVAEKNGWYKFVSMQSMYHLLNREDENEMNYYCQKTGVGLIPWSPLAAGLLARPVPTEETFTARQKSGGKRLSFTANDKERAVEIKIIGRVEEISKKKGVPMAAIATAWALAKGTNPIVGVSSVKRCQELLIGANLKLSEEEITYLEEPYVPKIRIFE